MQSRGSSISDVLTTRDVNEIADSPAGSVSKTLAQPSAAEDDVVTGSPSSSVQPTKLSYANVDRSGTVKFDEVKS